MTYIPDAEVVEICRDLVRIDTSNYGDGSGPGERLAAEYVAAQLAEVGIDAEIIESEPGRASVVACVNTVALHLGLSRTLSSRNLRERLRFGNNSSQQD